MNVCIRLPDFDYDQWRCVFVAVVFCFFCTYLNSKPSPNAPARHVVHFLSRPSISLEGARRSLRDQAANRHEIIICNVVATQPPNRWLGQIHLFPCWKGERARVRQKPSRAGKVSLCAKFHKSQLFPRFFVLGVVVFSCLYSLLEACATYTRPSCAEAVGSKLSFVKECV